ncbi:hypothetical protein TWF694_000581 [Orbilia ellipsospora]|uniref:Uncharacterized protein n=1 Tax=Orbilia ellipsospora TaxID=2528407 RepID=A0AAV9XRL1_9PEZI
MAFLKFALVSTLLLGSTLAAGLAPRAPCETCTVLNHPLCPGGKVPATICGPCGSPIPTVVPCPLITSSPTPTPTTTKDCTTCTTLTTPLCPGGTAPATVCGPCGYPIPTVVPCPCATCTTLKTPLCPGGLAPTTLCTLCGMTINTRVPCPMTPTTTVKVVTTTKKACTTCTTFATPLCNGLGPSSLCGPCGTPIIPIINCPLIPASTTA